MRPELVVWLYTNRCGSWWFRSARWLLVAMLALAMGLWGLDRIFPLQLPDQQARRFAQVVADAEGRPLRVFPDQQGVWRYPVTPAQVSPRYLQALLQYEDRWFYQHPGVNPLALLRAGWQWVRTGKPVSGGSTLTMQVARLLHPHSRTLWGKAQQVLRALQLEWHLDKRQILALYLNYAPFGGTLEGVQAASYAYLGKPASNLSFGEAALLAVLPQRPSAWRPDRYPDRARAARDKVLNRLAIQGVWQNDQIQSARLEGILVHGLQRPLLAPLLARQLHTRHPDAQVIHTTLQADIQHAFQAQLAHYVAPFPAGATAAAVLLNNHDLGIEAYVGTADFASPTRAGYVDMAQSLRSPGSTLKPFIYGLALDAGLIHSESLLLDVPTSFEGYRPGNFNSSFNGPVSMTDALQRSLNVPAVQVLHALSPDVFHARLAHAGLTLQLPVAARPSLALALGGASVDLLALAGAYRALGQAGLAGAPRWLQSQRPVERRLLSAEASWIIHHALRQPVAQHGQLYRRIHAWMPTIAYKTGTSYGNRDAWAIAVTRDYTLAVWVGRPDGTGMSHNSGRVSAVPLLSRLLHLLPADNLVPPDQPPKVVQQTVCWPSGLALALHAPGQCHQQRTAWTIAALTPPTLADIAQGRAEQLLAELRVDSEGFQSTPGCQGAATAQADTNRLQAVAVWPVVLEPWLPARWQRASLLPPVRTGCRVQRASGQLILDGLQAGAVLSRTPGESGLPPLSLTARAVQGEAHWYLGERWLGTTQGPHRWTLHDPGMGDHRLSLLDTAGKWLHVPFSVVDVHTP